MPTPGKAPAKRRGRPREDGIALPFALLAVVVIVVMGLAFLQLGRVDTSSSAQDVMEIQALAAAELGIERARAISLSQARPWRNMTYNGVSLSSRFLPSADPRYGGHDVCELITDEPVGGGSPATYTVVVEDLGGASATRIYYRVHSFGRAGNAVYHLTMNGTTVTYAAFGWLTGRENGIYFATGDVVDGWVYTNDQLNIRGSPVFKGRVDTVAASINQYPVQLEPYAPRFLGGLHLGSPPLDMGGMLSSEALAVVRARAQETDGVYLPANGGRPYQVKFFSNGTMTIKRRADTMGWETVVDRKPLASTNGAIYAEETVQVDGTVNGVVTIATPMDKDIEIVDNLVYAYPADPAVVWQDGFDPFDPAFNDRLGLIAGRDIVFNKEWSGTWTDMAVMAALLAVNGSIRNASWNVAPQRTLHAYGSFAQEVRGRVGQAGVAAGFRKDYKYDSRFTGDPPPYFPFATYSYDTWRLNP